MDNSLKNIFAITELRNRVLFTLGLLGVYRIGHHIPTPGVNTAALAELARQAQNTMFGLYDMFTGGSLSQVTIFALGVMPYISASIILQLLTVVWPYMEKLSKEGELGRRKITQYTRYGTILLSVVQSLGIAYFLERQTQIAGGLPLVYHPGIAFRLMTVLTLTTGTCFVMWLGEQITERGIGNGMSLIIFSGIVVGFPRAVIQTFDQLRETGEDIPVFSDTDDDDAAIVIYTPALQGVFDTAALGVRELVVLAPFPLVVWGADEIRRAWRRR